MINFFTLAKTSSPCEGLMVEANWDAGWVSVGDSAAGEVAHKSHRLDVAKVGTALNMGKSHRCLAAPPVVSSMTRLTYASASSSVARLFTSSS